MIMKESYPDTLASALDDLISKGGTWEQLENEGNKNAVRLGFKTRCTPGIIKAHIKYRQIKDPNYLGRNKITDKGIEFFQTVIQTADRLPLSTSRIERMDTIPAKTPGFVGLDKIHAREIIENAVESTKPRWSQYGESWQNIDIAFIMRGYEQQGFQFFKMKPVLEDLKILSIDSLGTIQLKYPDKRSYHRQFAGSMTSEFYKDLQKGICGREGQLFAESVRTFLDQKMGSPGRTFWKLLYQMLQACTYLKRHYSSSFAKYVIAKYASYARKQNISDNDFLNMSVSEWENFLIKAKPWSELMGIGPNVFDFILGDTIEAQFVVNSFKFDSANQHFFEVTGISRLIIPFDRDTTAIFLKTLGLPYTLREINKGVYTYCSKTESANYGFCRDLHKCKDCKVEPICEKKF